ncbi:MAG: WD40/YVTN/BNR-like repeat-containing protein [Syntrophobacteraceae bacterium]
MNSFRKTTFTAIALVLLWGFMNSPLNLCCAAEDPTAVNKIAANNLSYSLYSICFLDESKGWIGGKSGLLFKTEDGGLTWQKVIIDTNLSIFGIAFLDQKRGVIAGQGGLVMVTDDEGRSWRKVQVPTDKALLTLNFFDDKNGMAAGDWGKIIATNDGGRTWREVSLEDDVVLYGLKCTGPDEAWIAAEQGRIYHTTDGGKTWEDNQVAPGTLTAIDFDKDGNGLAVGIEGTVLRTTDRGQTWEKSTITRESLYNVRFNGQMALVVGDAGTVFTFNAKNENAWRQIETPVELRASWLQCIARLDENRMIIAGNRGGISFVEDSRVSKPGSK